MNYLLCPQTNWSIRHSDTIVLGYLDIYPVSGVVVNSNGRHITVATCLGKFWTRSEYWRCLDLTTSYLDVLDAWLLYSKTYVVKLPTRHWSFNIGKFNMLTVFGMNSPFVFSNAERSIIWAHLLLFFPTSRLSSIRNFLPKGNWISKRILTKYSFF